MLRISDCEKMETGETFIPNPLYMNESWNKGIHAMYYALTPYGNLRKGAGYTGRSKPYDGLFTLDEAIDAINNGQVK